jgi:hypothetical protein
MSMFALGQKQTLRAAESAYRCHCMIGTALIAFAGEPLIIFVLIAT